MLPLFITVIVLSITLSADSCGTKVEVDGGGLSSIIPLAAGLFGRKKRESNSGIQEALMKFDLKLTEDLANAITDFSEIEKEQFTKDLETMNKAVKLEASRVSKAGPIKNLAEFLGKICDKVAQDFEGKKWFNRLREFAGAEITKIVNEMSQKS